MIKKQHSLIIALILLVVGVIFYIFYSGGYNLKNLTNNKDLQSDSSEVEDIEKDLNSTDFSNLEKDLENIDKELN